MSKRTIEVFISYAQGDTGYFEIFREGLTDHLFTSSKFNFGVWDDSMILAGSLWDEEIQNRLSKSDLAILCVSAKFLNSKYLEAKEFGGLINRFPGTLIVPVYFNHCNIRFWDELASRQFFRPDGSKYNMANQEDFCFCDLVSSRDSDGKLNPKPIRDLYFMHLVEKIEEALGEPPAIQTQKINPPAKATTNYINQDNYPYFEKDNFFGREDLLKQINDKLNSIDLPLLLSGLGGMGKTSVALAYGKEPAYCNAYNNIAWVGVTENILSNLFSSFRGHSLIPFEYSPDGSREKDTAAILQLLQEVPGNNLLIIDNANDEKDIREFIAAWKKYQPGWKCLLTTRCENNAYKNHLFKLQVISISAAEQLFKRHNEEAFDSQSFEAIYEYIGGHTFLIELLAKYGQESSIISNTADLLTHLETKGINALNKNVIAKQGQQQETDKMVSEFVLGLYDPLRLEEKEQQYMRNFSVLPAKDIEFLVLADLFGIEEAGRDEFDNLLNNLYKKGWLIHSGSAYKCHQIIQEVCREKLNPDENSCKELLHFLAVVFDSLNLKKSLPYFEICFSVISHIKGSGFDFALMMLNFADLAKAAGNLSVVLHLLNRAEEIFSALEQTFNKAICNDRMGDVYLLYGDTSNAMTYYKKYNELALTMVESSPDDLSVRRTLAISYFKTGEVFQKEGNIDEAMRCFEKTRDTAIEMAGKYPDETKFRNIIGGTYSRIGDIYIEKNEPANARKAYQEFNAIAQELAGSFPLNDEYKNNLSISYGQLGDICYEEDDNGGAIDFFRKYHTLKKELADKYPENIFYKNGLAVSLLKLASLETGDEKKKHLTEAKEIWEMLIIQVPEKISYKDSLQEVCDLLAEIS